MAAFCLHLAVVFTSCFVSGESIVVAGEQVRTPGSSVTFRTQKTRGDGGLRHVMWQHGAHWLLWWNDGNLTYYGNATKDRILLNKTDGSLSISKLTLADSGLYTVELDDREVEKFPLRVISPVPVPRVSEACRVFCSLTCEGDTAGAGPVHYLWHHPHANISARTKTINTTVSVGVSSVGGFRCTMANDASTQMSPADPTPSPENDKPGDVSHVGNHAAVILAVLLVLVMLFIGSVVMYHRLRTGVWCPEFRRRTPQPNVALDENGIEQPDIKQPDIGQPQQSEAEQGLLNRGPHMSRHPGT